MSELRGTAVASDPVTLQIVANALQSIADEMATTITRTAHSTVVRDGMDFSSALCDAGGDTVAQAVSVPFHLGSIPTAMASLIARYGARVQGATEVALSMLDVLGYLDHIPICVAYEIGGERTTRFPVPAKLDRARPVYETLQGWNTDISDVRRLEDLPSAARDYVARAEELIEVPIRWVSVGPKRDAIIRK